MSAEGSAHHLLHKKVQHWIYRQGWDGLRPIQNDTIKAFIEGDDDLIVTARTAGGKTEAAFLPIFSAMVDDAYSSVRVLCVSPLKALINDHFQRLSLMCRDMGIPVHRWHGDVPASAKKKLEKEPAGLLLITPESLEALFLRRNHRLHPFFSHLSWVVIDELHVFLSAERGQQLQSLLNRLETVLQRNIRRIGLSATLGDPKGAQELLRPGSKCRVLGRHEKGGSLRLQVKGVIEPQNTDEHENVSPYHKIAVHLYKHMRGSNNLIFGNSRNNVELLAYKLRKMCEKDKVPEEFFPHHGNLSKDFREEVVAAYWRGHDQGDELLKTNAMRWFRGEFSTKTDARKALGVRTIVDDANFYDTLKLLSRFFVMAGYGGLLLCLDEMVNLYKLSNSKARKTNYEQILRILNDCLQGNVEGFGILFGGTPEFLMDPRKGLYSYEALQTRLAQNRFASDDLKDYSGPVISLGSLMPEDIFVLLQKIRGVYVLNGQEMELIPDEGITAFLSHCKEKIGDAYFRTPRNTIVSFVNLLAILEQNRDTSWQDLIGQVNINVERPSIFENEEAFDEDDDLATIQL